MKKIIFFLLTIFPLVACNNAAQKTKSAAVVVNVPVFSADSSYKYIQQQVDFGPRVPNTKAHEDCALLLSAQLKRFGAEVIEQKADLKAFDGTILKSTNIIGSFNPQNKNRVLLITHWDSRPWADHDPNPENRKKPVMPANDGASGDGVLLEIARNLGKSNLSIGIDIVFIDAEDYGAPENFRSQDTEDSWCLGTQYWAKNPHVTGYSAQYGILLDMVGASNAKFYREQASDYYAGTIVNKVWSQAKSLGFGNYFIDEKGGAITDDHIYVNKILRIPTIDIIQYDPNSDSGFGSYWHTINDTMDNVDKNTLKAVGTTLMHVLYNE